MVYEYFTNLNVEHIDVETIKEEFDIIKFQQGIEFSKSVDEKLSFTSDNLIDLNIIEEFSDSHQSDMESFLASTISFDDIYSVWKVVSLSFSKNIKFEFNQIQDFGIDLDIAQLLSKIFTLIPSVAAIGKALKEILILTKQIEVLAITNQITVTTTIKQIPISISVHIA